MLPSLQPSRPKVYISTNSQVELPLIFPQHPQHSPRAGHNYQQTRIVHEKPQYQAPAKASPNNNTSSNKSKPKSQIEAMPPFGAASQNQAIRLRPVPMGPPAALYDSAVRHPVFFTQQLIKPPFPIPQVPSQGFNPVANGYIMETRKPNMDANPKTKL